MAYQEDVNVNLNILAGAMGGVTAIMGSMSALTSTFSQMGTEAATAFGSVDAILVGATAMIAAFGVEAANAFGEYEQGMKIVQTVSGQSSAAISELGAKANELSVAYRTSIGDITDGLQTLGRAGLNSANEQIEVLESGLQTAKLEGRNLNGVLEEIIQNTAMLGGDLKSINFGEQADYLNSLMVGTSMTAPIDSHDISQTLQYAGGTAAAAGANLQDKEKLEDLMGTIAAFAQKGVSGSMAGTALRAFFTKPASQDKMVTAGLEAIGLTPEDLWEDGGESMKEVSDQIAIIQGQMDKLNLSTMDQVEIWGKIVGAKMGQQMMKLDSSTIKDLTRDIQGAQSAEALSAQTLQTYTQKISEFQQQGEIAFREFGEKVVRILTPIVEIGNWIMQFFSNPIANIGLFIGLGALFGQGLSRAWTMLKAVYGEVRNVINEARQGLASINALAGGSAPGFQQSASQVDYLNAKLHETDATLQAIQAKALGVKPGYMIPGGLPGDKIPRDTLRIMEENVVQDSFGVMGGAKGQYYSGEHAEEFKAALGERIEANSALLETKELEAEQKIAEIQKVVNNAEQIADEEHAARKKQLNAEYEERLLGIKSDYDVQRDLNTGFGDPDYEEQVLAKIDRAEQEAIQNLKSEMMGRLELSETQRNSFVSRYKPGAEESIQEIYDELGKIESDINADTKKLKEAKKNGLKTLQTRLEVNSAEVAEKWYKDLLDKEEAGTITESERYSLNKTRELWSDYQNQYALSEMSKEGVLPTVRSRVSEQLSPRDTMLAQVFESGDYKEIAQVKRDARANAAAVFAGQDTVSYRTSKNTEARLKSFEDRLRSAGDGLSRFRTSVSDAVERRRRSPTYVRDNASRLQNKGVGAVVSELNLAGKGMTSALEEVRTKLNISASEFAAIFDSEALSAMTGKGQLASQALNFRNKLIETIAVQVEDIEEREKVIMALRKEYDAHMKAAASSGEDVFGGTTKKATGLGGKFLNVASSVVDFMGGPLMASIMGFQVAMEVAQEIQRQWQERMQKAVETFSEAQDKLSTAEENISQTLKNQNDSVSDATIEQYIDYQTGAIQESYNSSANPSYSEMTLGEIQTVEAPELTEEQKERQKQGYTEIPGEEQMASVEESAKTVSIATEENKSELEKNTAALQAATYAYAQAEGLKQKEFQDGTLGWQGQSSKFSDGGRSILNVAGGPGMILGAFNMIKDYFNKRDNGFLDNNSPILTASQADQNYAGSTEFAGIFSANMYRAMQDKDFFESDDDAIAKALQSFFGNDYDQIIGLMRNMDSKVVGNGYGAIQAYGKVFGSMDEDSAARAQLMLKDNKSDFQKLGKQMFRYEQQYGFDSSRTAYGDFQMLKDGIKPTKGSKKTNPLTNRDLKSITSSLSKARLTVTDKNLIKTVERLIKLSDGKLTEANVLALGSMQQLQDMYQVANEQVAPGINQTVQGVYNTVGVTSQAASNAGNASEGAFSASNNAAAIAAFLGAQASETGYKATYQSALENGDATTWGHTMTYEEFVAAMNDPNNKSMDKYRADYIKTLRGAGLEVNHPDYTPDQIKNRTDELTSDLINKVNNGSVKLKDAANTVLQPLLEFGKGASLAAYGQSNLGEYGGGNSASGSGGSGGSGDGSGSGDKDSSGTRKERVDLVLCNKKEIPKLNVNLFKKAPNFTVLNKNFRLRDIKINSQDKPKAIMDAIKNGIIDTQKRMDPKIIQDDTAEYNPVEATDGSSTPSGTTKTTT